MKAMEGIYAGKRIKTLEPIRMPANVRVLITFLDTPVSVLPQSKIGDVAGCIPYKGKAKTLACNSHANYFVALLAGTIQ